MDWKLNWKDGREEGTLRDALLSELARADMLWMKLRFQAMINADTKQTGMTKFRGQEKGRKEKGISLPRKGRWHRLQSWRAECKRRGPPRKRGFSSELPKHDGF